MILSPSFWLAVFASTRREFSWYANLASSVKRRRAWRGEAEENEEEKVIDQSYPPPAQLLRYSRVALVRMKAGYRMGGGDYNTVHQKLPARNFLEKVRGVRGAPV